jgi:hypothetical protein
MVADYRRKSILTKYFIWLATNCGDGTKWEQHIKHFYLNFLAAKWTLFGIVWKLFLLIDFEGFWRWCMPYRTVRFILDFIHRLVYMTKITTFRRLDLSPKCCDFLSYIPRRWIKSKINLTVLYFYWAYNILYWNSFAWSFIHKFWCHKTNMECQVPYPKYQLETDPLYSKHTYCFAIC